MFIPLMCQVEDGSHGYPALYPNPRYSEQRYNDEVGVPRVEVCAKNG